MRASKPTRVPTLTELLALPDEADIRFGHAHVFLGVSRPHSYVLARDVQFLRMCPIFDVAGVSQCNMGNLRKYKAHRKRLALRAVMPKRGRPRKQQDTQPLAAAE